MAAKTTYTSRNPERPVLVRRRPTRVTSARRTAEEKELLLHRFDAQRKQGTPTLEAARIVGAPLASIYRWRREQEAARKLSAGHYQQSISIDEAITRLVEGPEIHPFAKHEAIFKFVAWLRWPTKERDHPLAITSCISSYLYQRHGAKSLDQLDEQSLTFLTSYLRLDVLRRMCSSEFLDFPEFEIYNIDDQPFTNLDVLANIVWFLLSYENTSVHIRASASLNKAFYLLKEDVFRYKWNVSRTTFNSFWALNGAAAPFLYVERFHPSIDWELDPLSERFANDVDTILAEPDELRRYFARCRWVIEQLMARLDPRAFHGLNFPVFPPNLHSEVIEAPPLPALVNATLRGYGKSYKYLR